MQGTKKFLIPAAVGAMVLTAATATTRSQGDHVATTPKVVVSRQVKAPAPERKPAPVKPKVHVKTQYELRREVLTTLDNTFRWVNGVAESQRRAALPKSVPVSRHITPSYGSGGSSCAYAGLIRQIWKMDAEWAISIAWRESRCIPTALGRQGDKGLFQLLGHEDMFSAQGCNWADPACNATVAWNLYNWGKGACHWRAPRYCAG